MSKQQNLKIECRNCQIPCLSNNRIIKLAIVPENGTKLTTMLKVFTKLLIQPEFLLILISCQDTHIYTINLLVLQDFHELMMVTLFQMLTCYVTFLFLTLGDFNRLFILFFIYLGNYIILFSLISVDLLSVTDCSKLFILYFHTLFTPTISEKAQVSENETSNTSVIR